MKTRLIALGALLLWAFVIRLIASYIVNDFSLIHKIDEVREGIAGVFVITSRVVVFMTILPKL